MKTIRCAIYTRKSSEEGLEQGFNSLHAQRETCAAYVMSQVSEGWTLIPGDYDDGGISGGTLERPGLQRLLTDNAEGRIDIVVVYKVDRLTRSLLDFAKLVEAFDKAGTSFVSITQSFNTTTSMGRLTLNMLLSFAQFEREVTAERIRDKIAASKAKGMWMGGTPPLGYRPDGRSLAIVEDHAELVRVIYRCYLEMGAVRFLADSLDRQGIRTPVRTSGSGRSYGDRAFTRGQLYFILKNPIYVGDIAHRGTIHRGRHPPIIDRDIWEEVQRQLANHRQGARTVTAANISLLAGKLCDAAGEPLVAAHASKAKGEGKLRYRYYVSRVLQHGAREQAGRGLRIPAREIERLVANEVADLVDDPLALAVRTGITLRPDQLSSLSERCRQIVADLRSRTPCLAALVAKVQIHAETIDIHLGLAALARLLHIDLSVDASPMLKLNCSADIRRTGHTVRLIHRDPVRRMAEPDPTLLRLIIQARRWWGALSDGTLRVDALAKRERVSASYVTRVVRLAFLAPDIVTTILDGKQDPHLEGQILLATGGVPPHWAEQRRKCFVNAIVDGRSSETAA
ncbi:recombinase family protein [Sphingosinicella microcystinivorans]|uniref:recombinase family protein n=1 Tax=Sphingosinicella microcystinivorans TaxID=335406 RepID=UPI0022F3BCAB|nr:recombinase family protein [Sphingosinicella microcystinivorans]WBX86318.1 recombinase family protein [Sphingosinicella microcystinivorans]